MKWPIIMILIAVLAQSAISADLSEYPGMLQKDGKLDVVFVIGDHADIADAIGAVEIATSLQFYKKTRWETPAKLASEISDVNDQNMIVVGGPCANPIAAQLLGYPSDCTQGFTKGRAVIMLFENRKSNSIIVAGANSWDTRRACRVLADFMVYKDKFEGKEIEVTGTSFTDMTIKQAKT
jgi:hypothetical protein